MVSLKIGAVEAETEVGVPVKEVNYADVDILGK